MPIHFQDSALLANLFLDSAQLLILSHSSLPARNPLAKIVNTPTSPGRSSISCRFSTIVGLSRNLLMNIGLCRDLYMDIRLCRDLLVHIGHLLGS